MNTIAVFSQSKFDRLIPPSALQLLPLKAEPISAWNMRNIDVKKFLMYVCDKDAEVRFAEATRKINYKSYWKTSFNSGSKKFHTYAKEFDLQARKCIPAPASTAKSVKIPSFLDDKYFGILAKYSICYDAVIENALSEDYFFSIAHLLETQQELDSSILLAQNLYYKQSLQVLRNFIELMVAQILFCYDSQAFYNWRNGNFRLPNLRGKNGLLEKLAKESLISQALSKETSDLYSMLNSYIHTMERNLIHRGLYKGQYQGFIFDYDYFRKWCDSFSKVVNNGILLLHAHFEQVANLRKNGVRCSVCHNQDSFICEEDDFAGIKYLRLKCKVCKNEMIIRT